MAAETALLDLVTPTQGTLTGSWGNTVNNGITEYVDIAIAGTLELNGDGAVTLANTIGNAGGTNIGSTTAQYAILKITGTLTATKVITAPSSSKTYIVDNTTATYGVTIKALGETGVTIVAGEKATVYFNGTDYVKVASSTTDGVSTISFGSTGLTPSTATSGAVTVAGTLAVANGGTGLTSGTSGGVPYYSATNTIASSAALTANKVVIGGGAGAAPSTTNLLGTAVAQTSGTYIQAVGYADTVVALGNTGAAINLDVVNGGVFTATLSQSSTITLRYPVATGSSSFTLILTNGGAGYTVSWSGSGSTFKWPGGVANLSRTTASGGVDVWVFFTPDSGVTWYGNIAMKNMTT